MNTKDFLFYLMIFVIVVLGVYLIWFTRTESYACMNSPLTYGVSKMTSTEDRPISCSCSFPGSSQMLLFNKDNITISDRTIYYP